jgi:hypothetical protein
LHQQLASSAPQLNSRPQDSQAWSNIQVDDTGEA